MNTLINMNAIKINNTKLSYIFKRRNTLHVSILQVIDSK